MDIVSAFNAVTGFTLQVTKTKCGSNQPISLGTIDIRDRSWVAHPVLIEPNFQFPVLGITVDLTNRWHKLQTEIVKQISSLATPLLRKKQSVKTKNLAFQMVVIPSIIYKAKFLNSSLQQFQALFAPLNRFTKTLYKLKVTVSRTLLHTSTQYGGLGIPDLL